MKKEFTNIKFNENLLPNTYFNEMQQQVMDKINANTSAEYFIKPLENIHYTVPENYFEKNITNIQHKVNVKVSVKNTWKYAAVACLFIIVGTLLFKFTNNIAKVDYLAKLDNVNTNEMLSFVEENMYDIETTEFLDLYNEKQSQFYLDEDLLSSDTTEIKNLL
jgi:hypothetical protein